MRMDSGPKEIGILVKPDEENKLVIHWRVTQKRILTEDNKFYGFKAGDKAYRTSMGFIKGEADASDYFEPTPRERSINPAANRALDYSLKKWPGWRNQTH